ELDAQVAWIASDGTNGGERRYSLPGGNLIATFFGRSAATNKHPATVIISIVVANTKHSKGGSARIERLSKLIADHNCHRLMRRGWWHRGLTNLLRERWRGLLQLRHATPGNRVPIFAVVPYT